MTKCDKGMALAYVAYKLFSLEGKDAQKIMYSETLKMTILRFFKLMFPLVYGHNDRLNPKLLCTDSLKSDELSTFHKRLMNNKFVLLDNIVH
jgi:hypothetical protein